MAKLSMLAAAAAALAILSSAAEAKCTRLGFSVNDYGKDGPTKDAKDLLDKYIAQWAAQQGIKNYRVGKKDVTCELFLDFGIFDEHTCKATASVCWGDGPAAPTAVEAAAKPKDAAPPVPAKKPALPKAKAKPKEAAAKKE